MNEKKPRKNPMPEMPRQQLTSVAEHEVLFSFNSDEDAARFDDWWHDQGRHSWENYDGGDK